MVAQWLDSYSLDFYLSSSSSLVFWCPGVAFNSSHQDKFKGFFVKMNGCLGRDQFHGLLLSALFVSEKWACLFRICFFFNADLVTRVAKAKSSVKVNDKKLCELSFREPRLATDLFRNLCHIKYSVRLRCVFDKNSAYRQQVGWRCTAGSEKSWPRNARTRIKRKELNLVIACGARRAKFSRLFFLVRCFLFKILTDNQIRYRRE